MPDRSWTLNLVQYLHETEFNMHHGTHAVNHTGSIGQTKIGSELYFEPVVQLTWVGSKCSVEPGSIMHIEPVVLSAYRRAYNSQSNV